MNHIKFKQLKIMTPNLLSPLTYKTYEDKSYKFTARKSGYVNIGDASIPKTVKYVRVVSPIIDGSLYFFINVLTNWFILNCYAPY